jgi:hypothetical protein
MFPLAAVSSDFTRTPVPLTDAHKPGYRRGSSFLLIVAEIKMVDASTHG